VDENDGKDVKNEGATSRRWGTRVALFAVEAPGFLLPGLHLAQGHGFPFWSGFAAPLGQRRKSGSSTRSLSAGDGTVFCFMHVAHAEMDLQVKRKTSAKIKKTPSLIGGGEK
jgi:hypothetical protein